MLQVERIFDLATGGAERTALLDEVKDFCPLL